MTTTCLLLLPAEDSAPAFWQRIDARGQPLEQGWLAPGQALQASAGADRGVLALPGPTVLCQRLTLQAHTPAQAQAAARAALTEAWLGDINSAIVQVLPAADDGSAWIWACSVDDLQHGLARAAAHNLAVAQVLPLPWLLAEDTGLVAHQGLWLLRDDAQAAAAEPDLIALLLPATSSATPPPLIAHLRVPPPGLCLRGTQRKGSTGGATRAASLPLALAALLLAAPLGLLASGSWLTWQGRQQQADSQQLAAHALARAGLDSTMQAAPDALAQAVARQQRSDAQWQLAADLLTALAAQPSLSVVQLQLDNGQVQLQLAQADDSAMAALRSQLQASGLQLLPGQAPQHWTVQAEATP